MFAIQNIKTGKFLTGTDYRYQPFRQITNANAMKTYDNLASAKADFISRKCGREYRIVNLGNIVVKEVIGFDMVDCYDILPGDWKNGGRQRCLKFHTESALRYRGLLMMKTVLPLLPGCALRWRSLCRSLMKSWRSASIFPAS